MKRILLLLALASCAHELCAAMNSDGTMSKLMKMIHSKDYQKEYDKINDWLMENVQSQEASDNIEAVKEHFLLRDSGKHSSRMTEAATQLVSMTIEKAKCTPDAVSILAANQASTRHYLDESLMRRIDRIVLHYSRKHSLDCRSVYPEMAARATGNYESPSVKRVLSFVGDDQGKWLDVSVRGGIRLVSEERRRLVAAAVVNFINSQESEPIQPAQNEKNGKKYLDKHKLESLVSKHIFEPCAEFLPKVKDVMAPCVFDADSQPQKYDPEHYSYFVKSVVGYHWCNVALKDQKSTLEAIEDYLYDEFSLP